MTEHTEQTAAPSEAVPARIQLDDFIEAISLGGGRHPLGGAAGKPRRLLRCPTCGRLRWHMPDRIHADDRAVGDAGAGPR